jgi:hypothetical protein
VLIIAGGYIPPLLVLLPFDLAEIHQTFFLTKSLLINTEKDEFSLILIRAGRY